MRNPLSAIQRRLAYRLLGTSAGEIRERDRQVMAVLDEAEERADSLSPEGQRVTRVAREYDRLRQELELVE